MVLCKLTHTVLLVGREVSSESDRMTVTDDFDVTHPIPSPLFPGSVPVFCRITKLLGEFYLTASEASQANPLEVSWLLLWHLYALSRKKSGGVANICVTHLT